MKPLFHPIKLTSALIFALVSFSSSPVLSEKDKDDPGGPDPGKPTRQGTTVRLQKDQGGKDPDAPGGPDPGRPTQQGTTVNRGSCGTGEDEDVIVTALVPKGNIDGGTDRERPTFWFYIDYGSNPPKSVHKARFTILNSQKREISKTLIDLPKTSSYLAINAPLLEKSQDYYRLYFTVICDEKNSDYDRINTNWVKIRDRNNSHRQTNINKDLTWYDTVDNMMRKQCQNPNNSTKVEWESFLNSLNLEKPLQQPNNNCSFITAKQSN